MKELHEAAQAYYNNGNIDTQTRAWKFFQSMDTDGDGKINFPEFNDFLHQSGYIWMIHKDPDFFTKLDRNGDGGLDFQEVLTFYYIIKTRYIWCHNCGVYLCGLYFTCVECFDGPRNINYQHNSHTHHHRTYDLCTACYGGRSFSHHHTYFLDNHILLRSKRGIPPYDPPNLTMAITPPSHLVINHFYGPAGHVPQRNRWFEAFRIFEMALTVASLASNCAIM